MNRIRIIILLLLQTALSAEAQELSSLLIELDQCVEQKEQHRLPRRQCIDSLKLELSTAHGARLNHLYEALYQNYSHFRTDSALFFLDRMNETPETTGDNTLQTRVELNRAEQLAIMGAYSDAENIVKKLSTRQMDREVRTRYYHVCRTIYGWMGDYMSNTPALAEEFRHKTHLYRDSIIKTERDEVSRDVVRADYLLAEDHADDAQHLMEKQIGRAEKEQKSYVYFVLSEAYRQQNKPEQQMRYLALAAIEDLKRGVTEYAALPMLANLLMEKNDVERAYNYLFCSMEDANYCNAKLRSVEISEVFPIIEKSYKQMEQQSRQTERALLWGVSLLAVLLIAAIFYLRKQMHKLSLVRKKLAEANGQLAVANKQLGMRNENLQETNSLLQQMAQVKEEYIALFLDRCRKYINDLEAFRKSLLKLAKNNQQAELMKTLKDDTLIENEQLRFYQDFDEAFLDIHPHFVERFNELLRPEERISPKKNERLNTELRIFALIRLGVTDTAQIAQFLNYSLPTIYNYRSRIRLKSLYNKDEFEKKLMEL
ncbi:MAG: hypothetical protein IJ693_01540 [Bacteroidaceae bacterium]|nr:hypothetical protein [Bacteroidaceae bacterium]